MTKDIYEKMHHQLAWEYGAGLISFDRLKDEIKRLDDHAHEYQLNAYGEAVCWCGAIK